MADAQMLVQQPPPVQSKLSKMHHSFPLSLSSPSLDTAVGSLPIVESISSRTNSSNIAKKVTVSGKKIMTGSSSSSSSSSSAKDASVSSRDNDKVSPGFSLEVLYNDYHVKASKTYDAIVQHEVDRLSTFYEMSQRPNYCDVRPDLVADLVAAESTQISLSLTSAVTTDSCVDVGASRCHEDGDIDEKNGEELMKREIFEHTEYWIEDAVEEHLSHLAVISETGDSDDPAIIVTDSSSNARDGGEKTAETLGLIALVDTVPVAADDLCEGLLTDCLLLHVCHKSPSHSLQILTNQTFTFFCS